MAGGVVAFDDDGAEANVSGCRLEADWHVTEKTSDDLLFVYTDHALIGASHSDVRDVGGALREDALVSGRNMSVSSEHSGDPAIQIPAERNFLGGGFGVNVHE